MRIKALTLATAFLSAGFALSAQENDTKETIKYSNVTEFGVTAASPRGVSLEATTAHGVSVNKKHHFGLGMGIGLCYRKGGFITDVFGPGYSTTNAKVYMPIFFNYRYYFKPDKTFSPHINVSVGGLAMDDDGYGICSSITAGFKVSAFSFSSGLSFMPIHREQNTIQYYSSVDAWGYPTSISYSAPGWSYLLGITLKFGFSF